MKQLSKIHKDKAEFDRMKREVGKSIVERGVNECSKLSSLYERKKKDLEKQHEDVRQKLEDEKNKVIIL